MPSSQHPSELESAPDSLASTPRSEHAPHELSTRLRFMCSFGGKILPRPHDNQLRYVGGDTRIVGVHRATTFSALLTKLSKLSGISNLSIKYQLPNEDLDALISVTTDEDLENMMDEYDRLAQTQNPKSARLRLFLFPKGEESRSSSISSLLNGSANRENWFFDALNGGGTGNSLELDRGRSEVSSIVSEMPDYLFGLDNPDEADPRLHRDPKLRNRVLLHENNNVPGSDPGSPAPVTSTFSSTASAAVVHSLPDLPPVRTKPDPGPEQKQTIIKEIHAEQQPPNPNPMQQPGGNPGNPVWQYVSDPHYSGQAPPMQQIPSYYYVQAPPPGPNGPGQPIQVRAQAPYTQPYSVPAPSHMQMGYHHQGAGQMYGQVPVMKQHEQTVRMVPDGVNHQVYYGVRNAGPGPGQVYVNMVAPGQEELARSGSDGMAVRVSHSGQ